MIRKYRDSIRTRHFVWLTLIYISAQWMLLVLSGQWYDDWIYADHDVAFLIDSFMQSSLPLHAFIDLVIWNLPFRYIVFVMYLGTGYFVYRTLEKINLFSQVDAFWITALFLTVPIFDVRTTFICFGYALGLFVFWIAFFLTAIWKNSTGKKRIIFRCLALFMLMLSFDTESQMLMTLVILLYLYYEDLKGDIKEREKFLIILKKFLISIIHNIDYLLAPIVWYVGDKILFPGYGFYNGHSYVKWNELPGIILKSPFLAIQMLEKIFENYKNCFDEVYTVVILAAVTVAFVALFLITHKNRKTEILRINDKFIVDVAMLLVGLFTFFIGIFPYIVKRSAVMEPIYTGGRDSVLLGIGIALIIYYAVKIILRSEIQRLALVIILTLGVIHFNYTYIDWQEGYYQQLQLRDEFAENEEIKEDKTVLVKYSGDKIYHSYYQTGGNYWTVTGNQDTFFICDFEDLVMIDTMTPDDWHLNGWMMKEYDPSRKIIDGIMYVTYDPKNRKTIVREKFNEMFNKDAFNQWIHDIKNINYVRISEEQSNMIFNDLHDGTLNEYEFMLQDWQNYIE